MENQEKIYIPKPDEDVCDLVWCSIFQLNVSGFYMLNNHQEDPVCHVMIGSELLRGYLLKFKFHVITGQIHNLPVKTLTKIYACL